MIQDDDEDILNSDFLKWATSIKQSFRYQLKDNIRKRIVSMQTAVNTPSTIFPFTTKLYILYSTDLSKSIIPLSIPLEVFVVSANIEDIEQCVNSAFDILLDKIHNGFKVVGNSQSTHEYRYFFSIASEILEPLDQILIPDPDLKTDQSISITYNTKDMTSNLFKDTYESLQRDSLL